VAPLVRSSKQNREKYIMHYNKKTAKILRHWNTRICEQYKENINDHGPNTG